MAEATGRNAAPGAGSLGSWWNRPIEELESALGGGGSGLTSAAAAASLAAHGKNALGEKRKAPALVLFLGQFKSPIVLILLFATVVSAFLHDWPDAIIILVIVFGSAVLSFLQEHSASRAAEKLRAQVRIRATVVRDGRELTIPSEEVVPGDVALLSAGSLIPADGRILESRDFFVSQAVLTGETYPVEKQPGTVPPEAGLADRSNCVFMGTSVRSGTARVLIVETGASTSFGQIAARLNLRPPETEFERGIRRLGYLLGEVTLLLVFAVFAVNVFFHKPVIDSMLFSLALAVGLTPQLLPAIININLSKGSQVMARSGVIVRRLASIENFGSMDVLCTDKTGTLTEGVVRLDGALDQEGKPSDAVLRAAFINARFQTGLANPLDDAIIAAGKPDVSAVTKVDEVPYDFVRKRLSVCVREGPPDSPATLVTKGALDKVLEACTRVRSNGTVVPFDDAFHQRVAERFAEWSGKGFRVLGVATGSDPRGGAARALTRDDEINLVFEGFLLFFDPPKAGVKEVVADLASLGIELKVITGDNRLVALHTAESIGLPVTGVITGADLDRFRDEALWSAASRANLFVEVDPNQKERILSALRKAGHVVGYMGDGINDAPALHSADVSISVDSAVDVAKEAADFVLMKKDLAVLHQGIVEGRSTFANSLKYVFMATSANFGNMFSVAGASLFLPFLPMLPKQILLINFLTDLPEMTIASDRVDREMVEQPRRWDIGFIRRFMLIFGSLSSLFDYATFALLLWVFHASPDLFRTGWFVESVLSAAAVVFVLRTRMPFLKSRPSRLMLLMTGVVAAIVLALPYVPWADTLLGFRPLPLSYLLGIFGIVAAYLGLAEVVKAWFYRSEAASLLRSRRPAYQGEATPVVAARAG